MGQGFIVNYMYVLFLSTSYGLNNPSVFLSISKFSEFLG